MKILKRKPILYSFICSSLLLFFTKNHLQAQTQALNYHQSLSGSSLAIDDGDTLWTGSKNNGLIKIHNNTYQYFTTYNSGIAGNKCHAVSIDSSGRIWAGGDTGISIFDKSTWTIINSSNSPLPSNKINVLYQTSSGCWIGTNTGLSFYDGQSWTNYNTTNSPLINDTVTSLTVNGNTIFAGTNAGVSSWNGSSWTTYPCDQNGLIKSPVRNVIFTGGRLWVMNDREIAYQSGTHFNKVESILFNGNQNVHWSWSGIFTDESGNLAAYERYTVVKIKPDLSFQLFKLANTIPGPLNSIGQIKNDSIYMVPRTYGSGYYTMSIDTNLITPAINYPGLANDYLDINNSTVRILNKGDMHWDPVTFSPQYFAEKNQTRVPVYASGLWLGGLDPGGQIHTSAMTYRQLNSIDFSTGPLDTIDCSLDSVSEKYYDRFWKIDYNMIQNYLANYQNGNLQNGSYTLPEAIATWPAHGNGNESKYLAPFIDINGDGFYDPYNGDYPELTGHQMLWWIFNDTNNIHTETNGPAFGFEIQGKAYAFNCNLNTAADDVMNNTTFYQYKITNRSQTTYNNVFAGLWCDFDLGNASDDYVASDTLLNTFYCYNGDNDDDLYYGLNPPVMNITVLKGPTVQSADGIDNNHNGAVDELNETSGLSRFLFYWNMNNTPNGNPSTSDDYYEYLSGYWGDGQQWSYGDDGRNAANPPTEYLFSGIPYVNAPGNWNMANASLQPDDVRGLGSCGPFTIAPGESRTIDFAYIFTRDSINPNGINTSIAKNTADVQKIINGFNSGNYPCLTSVGLPALAKPALDFNVYPNPSNKELYFNKEMTGADYKIYSVTGQLIKSGIFSGYSIPTENLSSQLYIINATKDGSEYVKRFIKM